MPRPEIKAGFLGESVNLDETDLDGCPDRLFNYLSKMYKVIVYMNGREEIFECKSYYENEGEHFITYGGHILIFPSHLIKSITKIIQK